MYTKLYHKVWYFLCRIESSSTMNNGESTFIFEIHQSGPLPTSSVCMNGLSGGSYELEVNDNDSEGNVTPESAFSFQNVLMMGSSEIYTHVHMLHTWFWVIGRDIEY